MNFVATSTDSIEIFLAVARASGAAPIAAIKAVRERFGLSLTEAKLRLHASPAWQDLVPSFEALHDDAEEAAKDLDQAV
jgi:ribosomal protein L7/L12